MNPIHTIMKEILRYEAASYVIMEYEQVEQSYSQNLEQVFSRHIDHDKPTEHLYDAPRAYVPLSAASTTNNSVEGDYKHLDTEKPISGHNSGRPRSDDDPPSPLGVVRVHSMCCLQTCQVSADRTCLKNPTRYATCSTSIPLNPSCTYPSHYTTPRITPRLCIP